MSCRFCGSKNKALWTDVPKKYYQCTDCLFVSVDPVPSNAELEEHYSQYHDLNHQESDKKNRLRSESYKQEIKWLKKYIDFQQNKESDFSVYDYGASGGYFLDAFKDISKDQNIRLYADDKSEPAIERLKEKNYYYNLEENSPTNKFDLVVLRGLVEHVPDFKTLLNKVVASLKSDGLLFITATPNGVSTCAQLYRHNWTQHHYPGHIQHFSAHHFDYYLAKHNMIRVDSTDLYYDSIYKKSSDVNNFIKSVTKIGMSFSDCKNKKMDNNLQYAFFGSMLTLLYRKADHDVWM